MFINLSEEITMSFCALTSSEEPGSWAIGLHGEGGNIYKLNKYLIRRMFKKQTTWKCIYDQQKIE